MSETTSATSDTSNKQSNVKITDEERKKLAEKLDFDLDEFISGLEKRSYQEGWPVDKWEEEMEKHPFFMTKSPEAGTPLSPLLQGLQDLKYDTTENTPEELAMNYKEDGNFNFKCRNYRLAIVSYTEGIKQRCSNVEVSAQLYNNRAASHYFLKNYRSSLCDCELALKLNPGYLKTICRAANCCFYLREYDKCVDFCDKLLSQQSNTEINSLRARAISAKTKYNRDERRKKFLDKKNKEDNSKLLAAIQERGIMILGTESDDLRLSHLEPSFPEMVDTRVYLDQGRLIWPVLFLYPEYKTSDFVQEFHEDSCFTEHLEEMYSEHPPWDEEKKYNAESVSIYFENLTGQEISVKKTEMLGNVLKNAFFRVDHGTPAFIIFVRDSKAEKEYLKST